MSNDFINRRHLYNRRRTTTSQTVQGEFITVPAFDTFIYHSPSGLGLDRWSFLPNSVTNSTSPSSAKQIPIGLMNSWNHSDGAGAPAAGALIQPRTPTRTVLGFNLQGVPTAATITDAKLLLSVAGISAWNNGPASDAGPQPTLPIQIRLSTTDITENATWTTKDASNFHGIPDGYYTPRNLTALPNPIPTIFTFHKSNPGVGANRSNEDVASQTNTFNAVNYTSGGYSIGTTVVEDALLDANGAGPAIGNKNAITITSLASLFMSGARSLGGLTMSMILSGKNLGVAATNEHWYYRGALASPTPFDASFYKKFAYLTFHSREADTTSLTSNTISFRKNYHHGFFTVAVADLIGISAGAGLGSFTYIYTTNQTFNWNNKGLSANGECKFQQYSSPVNETTTVAGSPTVSSGNRSMNFVGVDDSGNIATFVATSNTIPQSLFVTNSNGTPVAAKFAGSQSAADPQFSSAQYSVINSLTIRPQYSVAYGGRNLLGIQIPTNQPRLFGGTSNIGIAAGSYIQISGSASNDGIYQVISVQDGVPGDTNEANAGVVFQYLELSRNIVPEESNAAKNITIKNISNLPILHVKYTVVQ